jgi:PAS domain S-box-containing protein
MLLGRMESNRFPRRITEEALDKKPKEENDMDQDRAELEFLRRRVAELEKAEVEREKAEGALERSESYYRSLIRNAGDMITVYNSDFSLRWGSPASARITGYGPRELYGKPLGDLIHPDDIEKVRIALQEVRDHPGTSRHYEHRFLHADGLYHFHEVLATNLLEDPSVRGIVINSRDVTERKLMEEQLLARNRELDAFAYTVSHDLRTPLALVEGYAQLMRAEDTTEDEKEAYLRNIIAAARRMDEMTESLLEYAQAGQPGGEATPVDPAGVINELLQECEEAVQSRNITVDVVENLPIILVDSLKLRQVFANLVGNAVKHIGDSQNPRIEICAEKNASTVTFRVCDNGPGIDFYHLEEVFLPFRRFGSSSGLGIGLATVKHAVEGWGGRVWVESSPGEGTTFFFTAPAVD